MSVNMQKVGELREERGLSWNEVARRVPIDRPSIVHWRKGDWKPNLKSALGLARALGCTLDEILEDA